MKRFTNLTAIAALFAPLLMWAGLAAAASPRADCGPQSLAYLLDRSGSAAAATQVRKVSPPSSKGISIFALTALARTHGLNLAARILTPANLSRPPLLPAVVHLKDPAGGHYRILERIQKRAPHPIRSPGRPDHRSNPGYLQPHLERHRPCRPSPPPARNRP